jgi:hypothetical protein
VSTHARQNANCRRRLIEAVRRLSKVKERLGLQPAPA